MEYDIVSSYLQGWNVHEVVSSQKNSILATPLWKLENLQGGFSFKDTAVMFGVVVQWYHKEQGVQLKSGPYFNMSNLFTKIYNMLYYTTNLFHGIFLNHFSQ
jgi:hypothetical protein